MKYKITHSCGHTCIVNIYGPEDFQKSRMETYKKVPCKSCRDIAEEKEKERLAACAYDLLDWKLSQAEGDQYDYWLDEINHLESLVCEEIAHKYGILAFQSVDFDSEDKEEQFNILSKRLKIRENDRKMC